MAEEFRLSVRELVVEYEAAAQSDEGGEKHKVGEIAKVPDVSRQIADEDQLQKEG